MHSFDVIWRNPGHWDITHRTSRIFRIRGGEEDVDGDVVVFDERPPNERRGVHYRFKTIGAAMAYITAELMTEPKEAA